MAARSNRHSFSILRPGILSIEALDKLVEAFSIADNDTQWYIGTEILKNKRAEYRKRITAAMSND